MSPIDALPLLGEELLRAAGNYAGAAFWPFVGLLSIVILFWTKLRKIRKDTSAKNEENRHNAIAQNQIENATAEAQQHHDEAEIEALIRRRDEDASSGKRGQ